jgi:poly(3-hydroxybutyrate) depolymerase
LLQTWVTDPSLPQHTIYKPENPGENLLPVLVWGNGGCSANGTSVSGFLSQIASYGFIVIASGSPDGSGTTTVEQMTQSVEWAAAGANGLYKVDTGRIMAAGYSCGGIETYEMNNNDKVSSLGIFNSGLLENYDFARTIKKPIVFALGGPDDIAYANVRTHCPY